MEEISIMCLWMACTVLEKVGGCSKYSILFLLCRFPPPSLITLGRAANIFQGTRMKTFNYETRQCHAIQVIQQVPLLSAYVI